MSVLKEAAEFYVKAGLSWDDDLRECMSRGYVFSTPQAIMMGFQVGEGWFIRFAIGRHALSQFVQWMPHYLPYIGWARILRGRPVVKWHKTEQVLKAVKRYENTGPRRSMEGSEIIAFPGTAGRMFRRRGREATETASPTEVGRSCETCRREFEDKGSRISIYYLDKRVGYPAESI